MKTAVYTLYDSAGDVLYVGMTHNFTQRMQSHGKKFGERPVWWNLDWCETREEAAALERATIRRLRPPHNSAQNWDEPEPAVSFRFQIRDDLRLALKIAAIERGQSMKAFMIQVFREATKDKEQQ